MIVDKKAKILGVVLQDQVKMYISFEQDLTVRSGNYSISNFLTKYDGSIKINK